RDKKKRARKIGVRSATATNWGADHSAHQGCDQPGLGAFPTTSRGESSRPQPLLRFPLRSPPPPLLRSPLLNVIPRGVCCWVHMAAGPPIEANRPDRGASVTHTRESGSTKAAANRGCCRTPAAKGGIGVGPAEAAAPTLSPGGIEVKLNAP